MATHMSDGMRRNALVAGAQHRVDAIESVHRRAARARRALVAAIAAGVPALGSRKYIHRVRCSRLPPVVAMLRNCGEAPERSASESTGYDFFTSSFHARSEFRTIAPIRRPPSGSFSILSSGSRLMSTKVFGVSTSQLHQVDQRGAAGDKLRLAAPLARAFSMLASLDVIESFHGQSPLLRPRPDLLAPRQQCWCRRRSGRCCRDMACLHVVVRGTDRLLQQRHCAHDLARWCSSRTGSHRAPQTPPAWGADVAGWPSPSMVVISSPSCISAK